MPPSQSKRRKYRTANNISQHSLQQLQNQFIPNSAQNTNNNFLQTLSLQGQQSFLQQQQQLQLQQQHQQQLQQSLQLQLQLQQQQQQQQVQQVQKNENIFDEADIMSFRTIALQRFTLNQELMDSIINRKLHIFNNITPPSSFPEFNYAITDNHLNNSINKKFTKKNSSINQNNQKIKSINDLKLTDIWFGDIQLIKSTLDSDLLEINTLKNDIQKINQKFNKNNINIIKNIFNDNFTKNDNHTKNDNDNDNENLKDLNTLRTLFVKFDDSKFNSILSKNQKIKKKKNQKYVNKLDNFNGNLVKKDLLSILKPINYTQAPDNYWNLLEIKRKKLIEQELQKKKELERQLQLKKEKEFYEKKQQDTLQFQQFQHLQLQNQQSLAANAATINNNNNNNSNINININNHEIENDKSQIFDDNPNALNANLLLKPKQFDQNLPSNGSIQISDLSTATKLMGNPDNDHDSVILPVDDDPLNLAVINDDINMNNLTMDMNINNLNMNMNLNFDDNMNTDNFELIFLTIQWNE
ncbi:uncharacterized protein ASCRUDRAFT_8056 [Ascoidea rubescens DSM 1968]|uniref:Uncharacterized protein n=1 Tax=Ascoidea rubescens DSM 1968 TaxID=1344418 RepID=A0A1D2VHG6_9ASCO|nr:hypothetical protein ASCRUDRAFT_8056 [Ascoidea rubescens DSM 1968]ODV61098.1 hypothetical protein ASCRUDRAFT_8056 [Ascoidea rubescens DSM 1968]